MSLKRKRSAKALRVRFGTWAPSPGKGGYGGPVSRHTPASVERQRRTGGPGAIFINEFGRSEVRRG